MQEVMGHKVPCIIDPSNLFVVPMIPGIEWLIKFSLTRRIRIKFVLLPVVGLELLLVKTGYKMKLMQMSIDLIGVVFALNSTLSGFH